MSAHADTCALHDLVNRLTAVTLGVIGDFVLDRFVEGISTRISREAPVLILREHRVLEVPGGGANTVANALALGCSVEAFSAVGADRFGESLRRVLAETGLQADRTHLAVVEGHPTCCKERILGGLAHQTPQQIVRVDREAFLAPCAVHDQLIRSLSASWGRLDGLILADYGLGVISKEIRQQARDLLEQSDRKKPVTVDSRFDLVRFDGFTTITPNISEVEEALGVELADDVKALKLAGDALRRDMALDTLLVTRGKYGMTLFQAEGDPVDIPVFGGDQAVDVTGAGDTVITAYTAGLAAGASHGLAATLANVAGGLVVMKHGTATVTPEELHEAIDRGF